MIGVGPGLCVWLLLCSAGKLAGCCYPFNLQEAACVCISNALLCCLFGLLTWMLATFAIALAQLPTPFIVVTAGACLPLPQALGVPTVQSWPGMADLPHRIDFKPADGQPLQQLFPQVRLHYKTLRDQYKSALAPAAACTDVSGPPHVAVLW
jgi:hypothetical protein